MKGEKAILAEYDIIRKKEERNRMLRFNERRNDGDVELGVTNKNNVSALSDNTNKS